ncbi:hypothetical protein Y032_0005g2745 [Ancylostoma ceylanicum]|uniref:Uncharacterized protein n=1 Tax=Ancylostoma ceylanicum TaxID=53326 RepID=A0A016VTI3_9BILA|nr:hypothetical protein Y032_0005g2745 [Ancylostoma ceylanicum]
MAGDPPGVCGRRRTLRRITGEYICKGDVFGVQCSFVFGSSPSKATWSTREKREQIMEEIQLEMPYRV